MKSEIYLTGGTRTAIGGFCGAFENTSAVELGAAVVKACLARAKIPPEQVDEVIFGNVLSAGLGQNVARQVALAAGLNARTGGTTVNKVCGSGLKAVMLAAQAIECDDAHLVVAGGTENMSRAPYLLERGRSGYRLGNGEVIDSMLRDGLWDVYGEKLMGSYGDALAAKMGFSRQVQDDYAVSSYSRALRAVADGIFAEEIVQVETVSGKQVRTVVDDETPKRFDEAKLRQLRPAFSDEGTVTAGNASPLNDGAAALVVLGSEKLTELQVKPQARFLGAASYSWEPQWFTLAPIEAIQRLLSKLALQVQDVDLFEINEAFSVVPMAAMRHLGIPREKINVHGGAVALGHPIGASGARTLVTLLNAMQRQNARLGVNAICIGGGEALAVAVERC